MSRLLNPWEQFTDKDGKPFANGKVFFGLPNQDPVDNPKAPFSDKALQVDIGTTQTLDDKGMFQTEIFFDGLYSMSLFDADGDFVRTAAEVSGNESEIFAKLRAITDINFTTVAAMVADTGLKDSMRHCPRYLRYSAQTLAMTHFV